MALAGVLPAGEVATLEIPIHLRDAILDSPPGDDAAGAFDYVVGNPPWIAWDHLPQAYRQATRPLWEQYGLFSLSGAEARHGGGKKDLSMLMTYVAADRYLKPRGRLAFVITQTLFQTRGAGDGFRRFRLGTDGPWLRVLRVNDLVAVHPFPGTANWTSTIVLEKGLPTEYPVPYLKWLPGETRGAAAAGGRPGEFSHQACQARPIDPQQPSSPWFLLPEGWTTDLRSLIGPSDYQAHLGANSGGANGVYWVTPLESLPSGLRIRNAVQRGKHGLPCVEQVIESELVYPLLRWGDVERYRAQPSGGILMVQDPHTRQGLAWQTIQQRYPQTLAYLEQFRELLQARAAYRRYQAAAPFYSMYNVGPYTMAAHKVVWRRMDRRIRAAAVELAEIAGLGCRPVVPQETCVLVAVDSAAEADYLAAVLNSAVVGFLVRAHSVAGGKSFGTPGMLDFLGLRRYDPGDSRHRELSALGEQARNAPAGGEALAAIDRRIDDLVAELRGLRGDELQAIRRMESTG
jgi:hypothetical protein